MLLMSLAFLAIWFMFAPIIRNAFITSDTSRISKKMILPSSDILLEGITIEVPSPNKVVIIGCSKQQVGQFAAEIREKRPPEPYKGKGIKYSDEVIRRKVGKTGVKK